MFTHIYPHKSLLEDLNGHLQSPARLTVCGLCVWFDGLQVVRINCPYWNHVSLNNIQNQFTRLYLVCRGSDVSTPESRFTECQKHTDAVVKAGNIDKAPQVQTLPFTIFSYYYDRAVDAHLIGKSCVSFDSLIVYICVNGENFILWHWFMYLSSVLWGKVVSGKK